VLAVAQTHVRGERPQECLLEGVLCDGGTEPSAQKREHLVPVSRIEGLEWGNLHAFHDR
jgi:hypothetical protein